MDITFLGTAAATAMPLPFCGCPTCRIARKRGGRDIRRRSSLLINDNLLIDLGPDVPAACCQYAVDLTKVRYLLQTHAHSDHFDAGHFITRHPDYGGQDIPPITLAASQLTLRAMDTALQREDSGANLFSADFQRRLRFSLQPLSPFRSLQLGEYAITPLDALHDPAQQALIFFIEQGGCTLLYATDLLLLSEENLRWLGGREIHLAIFDQTYGEGCNAGGHLDAGQVAALARQLREAGRIRCVYATHISHEGNPPHRTMQALAKERGYSVAYDGLKLRI